MKSSVELKRLLLKFVSGIVMSGGYSMQSNFTEIRPPHGYSPVNLLNTFSKITSEGLLLIF